MPCTRICSAERVSLRMSDTSWWCVENAQGDGNPIYCTNLHTTGSTTMVRRPWYDEDVRRRDPVALENDSRFATGTIPWSALTILAPSSCLVSHGKSSQNVPLFVGCRV